MLSRRRWFTAAAVAAGLFCSTGQVLGGLIRRKRRAECPCPPVQATVGYPPVRATVGINEPLPGTTQPADFRVRGFCPDTGCSYVKCYLKYPAGGAHPATPPVVPCTAGSWETWIKGAPPSHGALVELHAELHPDPGAAGMPLDATFIHVIIQ